MDQPKFRSMAPKKHVSHLNQSWCDSERLGLRLIHWWLEMWYFKASLLLLMQNSDPWNRFFKHHIPNAWSSLCLPNIPIPFFNASSADFAFSTVWLLWWLNSTLKEMLYAKRGMSLVCAVDIVIQNGITFSQYPKRAPTSPYPNLHHSSVMLLVKIWQIQRHLPRVSQSAYHRGGWFCD